VRLACILLSGPRGSVGYIEKDDDVSLHMPMGAFYWSRQKAPTAMLPPTARKTSGKRSETGPTS
jgi:hypothetical protein